jgi:hypothetical protein
VQVVWELLTHSLEVQESTASFQQLHLRAVDEVAQITAQMEGLEDRVEEPHLEEAQ